ncbi:3893_t:CDS:2 [Funneliformis caledonium]|uniref:3893_t:CDS:1 n=1 Tax=Funneliformis caledonium TaxID=1117310 RepID=A0A9N9ATP8_9GLOM|nr:3893_t:CDS:2 [Funneliformis caledonium]
MSTTTEGNNLYALEDQKQKQEGSQQHETAVQIENFSTAPPSTSLTQGTTYALVPTSFTGTTSQPVPSLTAKKRARNVTMEGPANDVLKRKKGVKRGPYKRRTQQKAQDVKNSIISTSTPDIPAPALVPVSNTEGKVDGQAAIPIPKNLPINLSQITGTQVPITLTTSDGVGQFVIIPQSSGGVPYYILMPVQRQNQTSTPATSICASTDSSTGSSVQDLPIKIELRFQPEKSEKLLSEEESQKSKLTATSVTKDANSEIIPNKEREDKDKSNLSVLSLVCSDLLDKDTVSNELANKEMPENFQDGKSTKQNINTSVSWNLVNNNKQEVVSPRSNDMKIPDSVKNQVREENLDDKSSKASGKAACCGESQAMDAPRVNNPPSFETPSVGSPLLFSIPANTYPVAPAEYMSIKRESSIDNIRNVKRAKYQHEGFTLPQHGASFSQNQIPMQQPYYGIPPFITLPHSVTNPSNTYMAQNPSSPFYQWRYNGQQLPQQLTPTSLSFAFNPGMTNVNAPQSHHQGYANISAPPSSDVPSQIQKNYSNY